MDQPLRVETFESLDALRPLRAALRDLNLAARRPSPFQTVEYFAVHTAHDELAKQGTRPLFLVAFEAERPIGLLPMRRRPEPLLGVPRTRLELLTTHDTDGLGVIARAEDEERCAEAFAQHLFERTRGWTMLELRDQDSGSPLHRPPLDARRFYLRHEPSNPHATIDLRGGFEAWFRSLSQFRSTLGRAMRRLFAAGRVEFVACADRCGAPAMLELFLDLETRSGSGERGVGIGRSPTRVAKFRALLGPEQQHEPLFHWLLLDGLPIASMLSLQFANVAYQMEIVFDRAFAELGPGNVLFMLAVRDAVARGARAYNLLASSAYSRQRWNALVTETNVVQVYRRGSLHHQQAVMGEWRRRMFGGASATEESAPDEDEGVASTPAIDEEERRAALERSASVLATLHCKGVVMDRFDGEALGSVFSLAPPSERSLGAGASLRPAG